jgi:hypothetical protein
MSNKDDNKRFWENVSSCIQLTAGSAVKKVVAGTYSLLTSHAVDPDIFISNIFFDTQPTNSADFNFLPQSDTARLFSPANVIVATIPSDPESLKKAEEDGLTCYKPDGWYRNPEAALDNMGASADPTTGATYVLFIEQMLQDMLEKKLQQARDYDRQSKLVLQGYDPNWLPTRVIIIYKLSTVGGTGTGTMYWALNRGLRRCAQKDGLQSKIILNVLCRGNLPIHDRDQADINEFTSLKFLQVTDSGMCLDHRTGKILPKLADLTFVSSNQNNSGNIVDTDTFFAHQTHTDFELWHTPAGKKNRQRLVDIEIPQADEYGDSSKAVTASCAIISRDSKRVIEYMANMTSAFFAESLSGQKDIDQISRHAVGLARLYGLVETEQDSQITGEHLKPEELDKQSATERAKDSLIDRASNSKGLQRAIILDDSITSILNSDIPDTYEPMIKRQAQRKCQKIEQKLHEELGRMMRSLFGISQTHKTCAILKVAIERSIQSIMSKINDLRQLMQPHEQILADASERVKRLNESNWVNKTLSILLIRTLSESLEIAGTAAINYQLQISACTIAIQDFLMPLVEFLDRKLAWLSMSHQKLVQIAQVCRNKAKNTAEKPISFNVPAGIELADKKYLMNYLKGYIQRQGGVERLSENILNLFIHRHESILLLTEQSIEEVIEGLNDICTEMVKPVVEATDALDEFKSLYPDKGMQPKIFDQLIRQSQGSILTTDQLNQPVIWLKAVNLPSDKHIEWASNLLESVDKKPGKWETAVYPDPDKMSIIQLRNNISITSLLKKFDFADDPANWEKIVKTSPEPVCSLMVNPNPDARQLKRVLAKAIVNGQLQIDQKGMLSLKFPDINEEIHLGTSFDSVKERLKSKWPYLVYIESSFGRRLVEDEKKVISMLNDLKFKCEQEPNGILELIDSVSIQEALLQAELLSGWAKRMRKANKKNIYAYET